MSAADPGPRGPDLPLPRWRTLRGRLAWMSALAVALTATLTSLLGYLVVADALRAGVDAELVRAAEGGHGGLAAQGSGEGAGGPGRAEIATNPEVLCERQATADEGFQTAVGLVQLVRADGTTCADLPGNAVAPTGADVAAATGGPRTELRDDVTADGVHVRVVTVPAAVDGYALLVGRDLSTVDQTLDRIAVVLALGAGAGVALAMVVGLLVARAALRPIDDLTAVAEHIAATSDLAVPIEERGQDEVARLARAFNAMTGALALAREQQQQLVADASHELRTPLTSLRTNLELLTRSERSGVALPPGERQALLDSVTAQVVELGDLVSELTALARDEPPVAGGERRLDEVVRQALTRVARRGTHPWVLDLMPWELSGDAGGVERAVVNILDNAVKFSPVGAPIRVTLRDGELVVSDAGPGIPAAERDRVFDRFWRSPGARSLPGSGLGLAIVADTARRHAGRAWVGDAEPGAEVHLWLPGHRPA